MGRRGAADAETDTHAPPTRVAGGGKDKDMAIRSGRIFIRPYKPQDYMNLPLATSMRVWARFRDAVTALNSSSWEGESV